MSDNGNFLIVMDVINFFGDWCNICFLDINR